MVLGVISHDAGGAEVVSSYVQQEQLSCVYALDGPAKRIFERKLGKLALFSFEEVVAQSTSILCGSSWQSDLEYKAIKYARSQGTRSVAFLDHWVNYEARFIRDGECCLPDEIWVGDETAEKIAREIFEGVLIRMVANPYFKSVRQTLRQTQRKAPEAKDQYAVLYVCEPIREHALMQHGDERYWGYTEEDALSYFLSNAAVLDKPISKLLIRPHPSEPKSKYHWAQAKSKLPIAFSCSTLAEDIVESDLVVGCESMAMVIGLIAGKSVLSTIPPGGRFCMLPHADIQHMQQLIQE